MIDFILLKDSLSSLLNGAFVSLGITFCALIIGTVGGALLALSILYGNRLLRIIANAYITITRGTPMLVQLMALFFVLPYVGITIPAFWAAIIAIGLNSAAYVSEIIRAGIQAVGRGQIEAARTLGFSSSDITRLIVLPQAFRTVLPALGNECITLIKDSSLASVIGVTELNYQGSLIISRTYDALTIYLGVALIYLAMTSIAALLLRLLERKLAHAHA